MKFNKFSFRHWTILLYSVAILLIAIPLRLLRYVYRRKVRVVFYGHKLNGNILPIYNHWNSLPDVECYYITMDNNYADKQKSKRFKILKTTNFSDVCKLVMADAFVSDHGLHHFSLLRSLTSMKFIHVLHGIPFKGYDSTDFKHLHDHDQIWVSSEQMRDMHINRFGFRSEQVKVTGFARVEELARYRKDAVALKKRYGLSTIKKTILIAPTWKQDDTSRNPVPFGLSFDDFTTAIIKASGGKAQIIFRSHLNTSMEAGTVKVPDVHFLPYSKYPVAEEFLAISDVLITDWSSIGLDYLASKNPVIYLDVKPPFKKGFSVGPEYRAGAIVKSRAELNSAVKQAISSPDQFNKDYKEAIIKSTELAFGSTLDGRILQRCDTELSLLVGRDINKTSVK